MGIEVSIGGMDSVLAALDSTLESARSQINDAIQTAGINTEAGAKRRARVKTGRFRAGYQYVPGSLQCSVVNAVAYGIFLEIGTSKMPAYPSLFPAYVEASQTLQEELQAIVGI